MSSRTEEADVYLIDTDVISEVRKGERANAGVRAFFARAAREKTELYLSAITVGELPARCRIDSTPGGWGAGGSARSMGGSPDKRVRR